MNQDRKLEPNVQVSYFQTWATFLPPNTILIQLAVMTDNTLRGSAIYTTDSATECPLQGTVRNAGYTFQVQRPDGSQEKFQTDRYDLGGSVDGFGYFHGSWNDQFEFAGIAVSGAARDP